MDSQDGDYVAVGSGDGCHPECLNGCKGGAGSHQCIGCRNMVHESRCVARCPAGSFATVDKLCLRCHRDCVTCYGPGKRHCVACRSRGDVRAVVDVSKGGACVARCSKGYVAANATACVECPPHCDACRDDGVTCDACAQNFVLSADKRCVAACPEGQFADAASGACMQCHPTCTTCVGPRPSQCGLCRDAMFYYERSCVDKCPNGFFADPASRECSPCPHGCVSCASENECLKCQDSWQIAMLKSPNEGSSNHLICIPMKPDRPNCDSNNTFFAESKGQCEPCHKSCDTCYKGNDQSCLSCGSDHYLHISSCVDKACPNATFLSDATECRHCPHACSACASPKSCVRCHNGYFLSVSGQCLTGCPGGQRPDEEGRCRPCPPACQTCAGSDDCTACERQKVLVGGSCLDSCPEGFYRYQDTCRRCHGSCSACSGPEVTSCTACRPGWALNVTCLPCPVGQFYDSASKQCHECYKDCAACAGPLNTDCVTCRSPFLFEPANGTCVTCCDDGNDASPCCQCNAKRDACDAAKVAEEERSTRKRSSWSTESTSTSPSVTFVIVAAVFVAVVALATLWRRCRRHDVKARFRFRDGSRRRRVPRSPQISLRTFDTGYEKVPLAEAGGGQAAAGEDELSSSSDDDFYFKPTLNGDSDERRRLVTQSDAV